MSCEIVEQRTGQRPPIKVHPPRELTEEERTIMCQRRKNRDYFHEHMARIIGEHPNKYFVLVGEQEVQAFDEWSALLNFLDSLSESQNRGAYVAPGRRQGPRAHATGYRRAVTKTAHH